LTQERLDELIGELQSAKEPSTNNKHLLSTLSRWKQGEFFILASDHNYVWGLLKGEVGFAKGVKVEELPTWSLNN